jgi:hypothetical protein
LSASEVPRRYLTKTLSSRESLDIAGALMSMSINDASAMTSLFMVCSPFTRAGRRPLGGTSRARIVPNKPRRQTG